MALTRSRQSGFTIVETLVALVLLMVGFLALSMLHIGAARANSLARRNTLATILAYEQIERFQRIGQANISAGNDIATIDGRSFTRTWTASTNGGRSMTVDVTIGWADQWGSHNIKVPSVVR